MFEKLTPQQRITAVNIDCMRHPQFAMFAGHICMGESLVLDSVKTAQTDGCNKQYGTAFVSSLNRKQLRYLVLHEVGHIAYLHCVAPVYKQYAAKYGHAICNKAADYVVNGLIEAADPQFAFVERPTEPAPLVDSRFAGMSYTQVLRTLVEESKSPSDVDQGGEGGEGAGNKEGGETLDEHICGGDVFDETQLEKVVSDVALANQQGSFLASKLAGAQGKAKDLFGVAEERSTSWADALREFLTSTVRGDDISRYCPPNKRFMSLGVLMPTHHTECLNELVVACDTSDSMHDMYPVVFGEIARICADTSAARVRVLWWDTSVVGEQVFQRDDFAGIATLLAPVGGGGTHVSCVAEHIEENNIHADAIVYLTDGLIESEYKTAEMPALWGVVDNDHFAPRQGKVVHIRSTM